MADDTDRSDNALRYDRMVEDALLSVVHRSLSYAAENGLPGDHHFYITFRTDHPGVDIPNHLRERYPGEMTIILQYQFWDLEVGDDIFSVTLSFSDVPEKLTIPFEAVAAFADPSVRFGLQFDVGDSAEDDEDENLSNDPALADDGNAALSGDFPNADPQDNSSDGSSGGNQATESDEEDPDAEGDDSDNVVTLDTFRKK
ncbi:SspB family protein [Pelagibius sp. Alg239-R121]|uniref:SspB family protein n=1 Tax=Pelagibius sp. Alg239-R121 TaxID=2993448 RepID=UPI0024A7417F|nr:ClpXP protease specificity-enhancing factor SspB [Pelagibius sp. Alg239-R121]